MLKAKLRCPECGYEETIKTPKDRCLAFHVCNKCKKFIKAPKEKCCVICAYSDKKC